MKALLAVSLLLLVAHSLAKQLPKSGRTKLAARDPGTPGQYNLDLDRLPQNVAVVEGATVVFSCGVEAPSNSHSIQWTEFASNPNGAPISDNELVGNHPQRDRYTILHRDPHEYSLQISAVRLADGGYYQCRNGQASPPNKRQHQASLTVIASQPNCTSTIGDSGVVLDLAYHTNDCILNYRGGIIPNKTWSGIGPFNQLQVSTTENVWAGMALNVTRAMDTRAHQCTTFFTGHFLPVDADSAENVPTFTRVFQSKQMFVYWGPQNHDVNPKKDTYEAGDVLTCTSDAFPDPLYQWQNMRTNEIFTGNTVTLSEAWRGFNQTMRCQSQNTIEGTNYASNVFQVVYMPPLTEPPTTLPTTTTTPPPPVAPCRDLTGPWISDSPTRASLCVRLDLNQNGAMTGLLKNATDTYWVDIVGRAQADKFDQIGFNGIWPVNIGVSSFVGECHRCFGVEQLLVNVVSKTKGEPCGTPGRTQYTTQYSFRRADGTLTCPNIPTF